MNFAGKEAKYVHMFADECLSIKEIAARVHRSHSTITTTLRRVQRKIGAKNMHELIKFYWLRHSSGEREFRSWGPDARQS